MCSFVLQNRKQTLSLAVGSKVCLDLSIWLGLHVAESAPVGADFVSYGLKAAYKHVHVPD